MVVLSKIKYYPSVVDYFKELLFTMNPSKNQKLNA